MQIMVCGRAAKEILKDDPKIHRTEDGFVSWRLEDKALYFIENSSRAWRNTLETGAGVSTILFAALGVKHICINPNLEENQRIIDYCQSRGIATKNVEFICDKSEYVLPILKINNLDFCLIDGDHKFPVPFIDWYYLAEKLKVGGLVMIDDLQHWTCYSLREFLEEEPGWKIVKIFHRSVVFQKTNKYRTATWWGEQPFMLKRRRLRKAEIMRQLLQRFLKINQICTLQLLKKELL